MGNIISNINPSDVQEVNKVLKKHIKEYENKVTNLKNFSDKKIEELDPTVKFNVNVVVEPSGVIVCLSNAPKLGSLPMYAIFFYLFLWISVFHRFYFSCPITSCV